MLLMIGIISDLITWGKESSSEKENGIGNNADAAVNRRANAGV